MIDLSGKQGVVFGVANQRSIATAVVRQLRAVGAELALTYGPDTKGRFEDNVRELAQEVDARHVLPADVRENSAIESVFAALEKDWGGLDFVVHSVAYAERSDLEAPFSATTRDGWMVTQGVSAYSLLPMARCAAPLMRKRGGGALVAMTFIGSVLAVPQYHVMGPAKAALESAVRYLARELGPENIRCNAVSAGALRTLSSSGIKNFGDMLKIAGEHAALTRNVTVEEIASTAVFLVSPAAGGITGQCIYVDGGFNIMAN
jgi:enoyl-[acyl-carrier protein] reductase I